jgi:hypothetical protein
MKVDLSNCNVIELGRDCTVTLNPKAGGELVGVRGLLWVTSTANRDDVVLAAGDRIALTRNAVTYVTAFESGALRVIEANKQRGWYERLMRRANDLRSAKVRRLARVLIGTVKHGAMELAHWIEIARRVPGVRI